MKAFLISLIILVIITIGVGFVFNNALSTGADTAYTSSSTRL